MRRELPYPGNVTTTPDKVTRAIVDGLVSRQSRVYVPKSVGAAGWGKATLSTPAARLWAHHFGAKWTSRLEAEIDRLGPNDPTHRSDPSRGNS